MSAVMGNPQIDYRVVIEVTKNGYIVRPNESLQRDYNTPICDWHVFESFGAMVNHLRTRLPVHQSFTIVTTLTADGPKKARRK